MPFPHGVGCGWAHAAARVTSFWEPRPATRVHLPPPPGALECPAHHLDGLRGEEGAPSCVLNREIGVRLGSSELGPTPGGVGGLRTWSCTEWIAGGLGGIGPVSCIRGEGL